MDAGALLEASSSLALPPTGRWATSQSAFLRGLFNNVEGKRDKNESGGEAIFRTLRGAPLSDIYLEQDPQSVCVLV